MKKYKALFLLLLVTSFTLAQKSEKVKGSKIVTIEEKEIGNFTSLEIGDGIEIHLEKGEKNTLKIEADDNLHEAIAFDLSAAKLQISTSRTITSFKKLIVRVTYTDELKLITVKDNVNLNAIQEIQLDDITIKSFDNTKLYLNVNSKKFTLQSDNSSKTELNLKSENAIIQLSKNATLKALITSPDLKCDLYQKAKATIEGDITNNGMIRLDNNSVLTANNLTVKKAQLIAEGYSDCSINVNGNLVLDASGNSEIQLYGEQKIEMKKFADNTILRKKPTK
ncbi:MAG: DUF2807 domain-containing protein [Bacteroidota bacterium]